MHETNTFSVQPTTVDSFENGSVLWLEGLSIDSGLAGTNTETAGFFEVSTRGF